MSILAFAGGVKSLFGGGSGNKNTGVQFGDTFQAKLDAWKMGVGLESDRVLYNGEFRRKLAELEKAVGAIPFGSAKSGTNASTITKFRTGDTGGGFDLSTVPKWVIGLVVVVVGFIVYKMFKKKRR